MEENAALLTGMKSAFQLSNDKVAHIGDVLSMTMNKTAADFDGMSDALTYAAPVAKNAGVSIEETAAMVGGAARFQNHRLDGGYRESCRSESPAGANR